MRFITVISLIAVFASVHAGEDEIELSNLGFQLQSDLERWELNSEGTAKHELEIENKYLGYNVNPVAMKRFMSMERALIRPLGLPTNSTPPNENFEPSDIYRGEIHGIRESDGMLMTVVVIGYGSHILSIRIRSYDCQEHDHHSILEAIEAQQVAAGNDR